MTLVKTDYNLSIENKSHLFLIAKARSSKKKKNQPLITQIDTN